MSRQAAVHATRSALAGHRFAIPEWEKFRSVAQTAWKGPLKLLQSLQFLSGFKSNGLAGRNCNLSAGAGIASDTGLARPDIKNAKTPKLDALPMGERSLHTL